MGVFAFAFFFVDRHTFRQTKFTIKRALIDNMKSFASKLRKEEISLWNSEQKIKFIIQENWLYADESI